MSPPASRIPGTGDRGRERGRARDGAVTLKALPSRGLRRRLPGQERGGPSVEERRRPLLLLAVTQPQQCELESGRVPPGRLKAQRSLKTTCRAILGIPMNVSCVPHASTVTYCRHKVPFHSCSRLETWAGFLNRT
ncbi:hypothetical protein H1C71_012035 [Ictidomys tridecemlineatus]|nr:hypothetical protein H1C71_012035 [Ictidomys tridecemlineatus]